MKLGVDVRTGETVAVKIMYKDNMSARAAQQLRREITSMKALNHPNVLRLKDVHEVGTLHTSYKFQIRSDMLQMQDAHQGKRYLGREDAFKFGMQIVAFVLTQGGYPWGNMYTLGVRFLPLIA